MQPPSGPKAHPSSSAVGPDAERAVTRRHFLTIGLAGGVCGVAAGVAFREPILATIDSFSPSRKESPLESWRAWAGSVAVGNPDDLRMNALFFLSAFENFGCDERLCAGIRRLVATSQREPGMALDGVVLRDRLLEALNSQRGKLPADLEQVRSGWQAAAERARGRRR